MDLPPRYKYWLSYLTEIPVVSTRSDHNPELDVVLHRGRFKLLTNGAIYSFGDLYSNYYQTFERLRWDQVGIKTCLVLGLGLGSIPYMLSKRFQKDIRYTAVEIDEVVTQLAQHFVLKPNDLNVEVFTADAASFLQWHHGTYDLICSDVFVGDAIPSDLQSRDALHRMKAMLRPGGILMYNRLSRFKPDIDKSLKFRDQTFMPVFPEGGFLDVDGNWMFVNRLDAFDGSS